MKKLFVRTLSLLTVLALIISLGISLVSCDGETAAEVLELAGDLLGVIDAEENPTKESYESDESEVGLIDENGVFDDKENVALYIHTYGKLPDNYITKKEAEALGWEGGSVEKFAEGKCIGGSGFGNYEGLLPEKDGRKYYECDIDTLGESSRGAKRIVYSNDGLIYYTDDHYESFELLYGDE